MPHDRADEADWRRWFPDLVIPPGLTFEDLQDAAGLVAAWEKDEAEGDAEWSPVPLVVRIYERLSKAAATRSERG